MTLVKVIAAVVVLTGSASGVGAVSLTHASFNAYAGLENCIPAETCYGLATQLDRVARFAFDLGPDAIFGATASSYVSASQTVFGVGPTPTVVTTSTGYTDSVPVISFAAGNWFVGVEETAPTPVPVSGVPLLVTGDLTTTATIEPIGPDPEGVAAARADATVKVITPSGFQVYNFTADWECGDYVSEGTDIQACGTHSAPSASFAVGTTATIGTSMFIDQDAFGGASSICTGDECGSYADAKWRAIADPTVVINPSFPYIADFELVASPELYAAGPAVSEPNSLALLAVGLLLLATRRVAGLLASRPRWRSRLTIPWGFTMLGAT